MTSKLKNKEKGNGTFCPRFIENRVLTIHKLGNTDPLLLKNKKVSVYMLISRCVYLKTDFFRCVNKRKYF